MGGFECSTHRRGDSRRIDVVDSSRHDRHALPDYERLLEIGMRTARDGIRWHLIERKPYEYDFSSADRQIAAARALNIQIIWDIFHYGYPDDLDLMSAEFPARFASFAAAFTRHLLGCGIEKPYLCLVDEISFFAWIAGQVGGWYPFLHHRGDDVKRQLVKASLAAAAEIKKIAPHAVLIQTDPVVNVLPSHGNAEHRIHARNFHNAQYHALDMLLGLAEPEIGGSFDAIDVIGVNYYSRNQWRHPSGRRVRRGTRDYKPFREILSEFYARYRKPLIVAETGIEGEARAEWFRDICAETYAAIEAGVPVWGICLYPILNHPGWDDDRHCHNGLWDYPDEAGGREIHALLAAEISAHAAFFESIYEKREAADNALSMAAGEHPPVNFQ